MSSKETPSQGRLSTQDKSVLLGETLPTVETSMTEATTSSSKMPLKEETSLENKVSSEVMLAEHSMLVDEESTSSEDTEEDMSEEETEEEDSDDEILPDEVSPQGKVTPEESTLELTLQDQSKLSIIGVDSEELLHEYLDHLPHVMPDAEATREHIQIQQQQPPVPPQSPRLALLELHSSPLFKDEPLEKDRRLENWDQWLKVRKNQHRRIGSAVNREPPSLTMNSGEDVRYLIERKTVLDYARIPAPPDYYRGGPEFWRMPTFLQDKGDPELPFYTAQLTLPDKGIVPTVEYVGVPDHIKKEKEVYGPRDIKTPRKIWDSNTYLKQQKSKLREKLEMVEPYEPDMKDLVIIGNYWKRIDEQARKNIPVLTVTEDPADMCEKEFEDDFTASLMLVLQEEREGKVKPYRDMNRLACLKIQDREFYYVDPPKSRKIREKNKRAKLLRTYDAENPDEFRLTFSSPLGKIETNILRLENRGTVKVCYSWKRCVSQKVDFPEDVPLKSDSVGQHFFFNKNNDLILPGQVLEFCFMYRSHFAGIFQENWKLLTEPTFVEDDEVFTVNLWGITPPPDTRDELHRLRDHIDRGVKNNLAREVIYDALRRSKFQAYPDYPYRYNFLMEEKFLHVNPDYNYDAQLVSDLCDLYARVNVEVDFEPWDLKIPTLRQIIIEKSSWEPREEYLEILSEIVIKLRKRVYTTRVGGLRKYTCVYNLLRNLANTIEREGHNLKFAYGLLKPDEVPLEVKFEKKQRTPQESKTSVDKKKVKPKPKGKRGGKTSSMINTTGIDSSKAGRHLYKDTPSSSSISNEDSDVSIPGLSPSMVLSLTAMYSSPSKLSEATLQLLSTLTPLCPVEPMPSLPLLPIILPANDDMPATEVDEILIRRVYRQSLFVMVNQALCHTVEHISAALDSYNHM